MSGSHPTDIRSLTLPELEIFFLSAGEKKFRAKQVYDWLWKRAVLSFDEMTSLPLALRRQLQDHYLFQTAILHQQQVSSDGTIKSGFRLHDGLMVEGVWIPAGERVTLCISSQVGCALGCKFCATGRLGFTRNLSSGEIFDQVTAIPHPVSRIQPPASTILHPASRIPHPTSPISNLVFMGMGEPLLNYEQVIKAIDKITSPDGLGMSPQRITVSSVGIPKMIRKMADDDPKFHFALSLHAATDNIRDQIIPFNLNHPVAELAEALAHYHKKTGKRFTIEYILFDQLNDSISDARALALFCKRFPVKINIIEYNPIGGGGFSPANPVRTKAFVDFLENRNLVVNLRLSRGKDIDAACGQLAGKQ